MQRKSRARIGIRCKRDSSNWNIKFWAGFKYKKILLGQNQNSYYTVRCYPNIYTDDLFNCDSNNKLMLQLLEGQTLHFYIT